jgi:hypothetical protein
MACPPDRQLNRNDAEKTTDGSPRQRREAEGRFIVLNSMKVA